MLVLLLNAGPHLGPRDTAFYLFHPLWLQPDSEVVDVHVVLTDVISYVSLVYLAAVLFWGRHVNLIAVR